MDKTVIAEASSTSLLAKLRHEQTDWLRLGLEQKLEVIVRHKSEFPSKIRHCIDSIADSSQSTPQQSWVTLQKAITKFFLPKLRPWGGLDNDVDTKEEAEVAIRVFPTVLQNEESLRQSDNPIGAAMSSLKALPFVPMLAELGRELGVLREDEPHELVPRYDLFLSVSILTFNPEYDSREFDRQLDEALLSVLVGVKEKNLMRKEIIDRMCIHTDFLYDKPNRIEKRVRFLLNWDPTIIKKDGKHEILLHRYVGSWDSHKMPTFKIFQAIFELGVFYYPEDFGFMFHSDLIAQQTCFEIACETFGDKKVRKMVDEIILQYIQGRRDKMNHMLFAAASNEAIHLEGLYTLFRLNVTMKAPSGSKRKSRKRTIQDVAAN